MEIFGILPWVILSAICLYFATKIVKKTTHVVVEPKVESKVHTVIQMTHKMSNIIYFNGDVLEAIKTSKDEHTTKILLHICNNKGGWGAGFVLALSKVWPQPEATYRLAYKAKNECFLGDIQVTKVDKGIYVVSMIAQDGYKTPSNPHPLNYDALQSCLEKIMQWINDKEVEFPVIYGPKFGTGLAGGDWILISEYLKQILGEVQINIYEI